MLFVARKKWEKFEFVAFVQFVTWLLKILVHLGRDFMLVELFDESFADLCFHVNTKVRVLLNAYVLNDPGVNFYAYY